MCYCKSRVRLFSAHVFLFAGDEVVGQRERVLAVDVGRDLVEARDEGVFHPVHEELGDQHHGAVGQQHPQLVCPVTHGPPSGQLSLPTQ